MTARLILPGGAPHFLTASSYVLGRGSDCDVLLPASDDLLSRHHARLERDASGQWWLHDTSSNGTFVNGENGGARRAIYHGDQIGVGRSQIAFDAPHLVAPPTSVPVAVAALAPASATQIVFQPIASVPAAPTEEISLTEVARAAHFAAPLTEEVPVVEVAAPPVVVPVELPLIASPMPVAPNVSPPEPRAETTATPPTFRSRPREIIAPLPAPPVNPTPAAPEFAQPAPPTELELPVVNPVRPVEPPPQMSSGTPVVIPPIHVQPAPPTDLETPIANPAPPVEAAPQIELKTPPLAQPQQELPLQSPAATQKQCTRCRALYSFTEEACPQCGAAGFKVKAATIVAPQPQSTPQNPVAPAPLNSPYSAGSPTSAQTPAATPFDSQIKVAPVPLTALAGAVIVGFLLMTLLPWIQINIPFVANQSLNYFQCWDLLQQSGAGRSGEGAELGLMLLIPPIAFAAVGGALITSLDRKTQKIAAGLMLAGGVLGVVAAGGLFLYLKSKAVSLWSLSFDPSSLLGAGFWGFALLSAAALGIGLWMTSAGSSRK